MTVTIIKRRSSDIGFRVRRSGGVEVMKDRDGWRFLIKGDHTWQNSLMSYLHNRVLAYNFFY